MDVRNVSVFVFQDVFFELETLPSGRRSLRCDGGLMADWPTQPTTREVREACETWVEHLVCGAKRASGDCICTECEKPYREHPPFRGAFFMEHAYLNRLCSGELVKL